MEEPCGGDGIGTLVEQRAEVKLERYRSREALQISRTLALALDTIDLNWRLVNLFIPAKCFAVCLDIGSGTPDFSRVRIPCRTCPVHARGAYDR